MKKLAVGVAAVLSLLACTQEQPLPPDKAGYAGDWRGDGVALSISPAGGVTYRDTRPPGDAFEGAISGWHPEGMGFSVGTFPSRHDVVVDAPPHDVDGKRVIKVNGVLLEKER